MTLNHELLAELVPLVAKKLAASAAEVGDFNDADYFSRRDRRRAAEKKVMDFFTERYDARWSSKGGDCQLTMAGIRSTSTCGWTGALQNWQRSAEKKLGVPR